MKTQEALEKKSSPASPIHVEAEKLVKQIEKLTQSVAKRAYGFFEERGHRLGNELEDWFRAEAELLRPVPVEMKEDEKQFMVRAETPGFKANEIRISAEPERLIIEGKTEEITEEKSEKIVFSERRSNQFCRSLRLSAEIEPAKVTTTLKDGVLEITLPKAPTQQAVGVEVKAG